MIFHIIKLSKRLLFFLFFINLTLQAQVIDKVIAVLDDNIILQSDLENQYIYQISNSAKDDGTLRCQILESILTNKLLLSKAKLDSLTVADDQVEQELNRRIANFIQYFGSQEKLEEEYKKSLVEIKVELRPDVRELLLVEQQKSKITADVTITPKEVKEFFSKIPKDSIPYLPAEVIINQIVVKPPYSEKNKKAAKTKLEGIHKQIQSGKSDFQEMAKLYSMDGSGKQGGYLGEFGRGQMVPEFEAMAFSMKEGDLSKVFETEFGYHIIQLHKRMGDRISASHILIKPIRDEEDDSVAIRKLVSVKSMVKTDTISFQKAATIYSEDKMTRDCGGCIINPQTGESRIPIDQLDADLFFKIDRLKEKEISEPMPYFLADGTKGYHIVLLQKKFPPHAANISQDYQKIQTAALQEKQSRAMEEWFITARKQVFIDIKENECLSALKYWKE
jgi:peptidyl-prolyl cis-trans isomerase SurA